MMTNRSCVIAGLLSVSLLAAGCGGDSNGTYQGTGGATGAGGSASSGGSQSYGGSPLTTSVCGQPSCNADLVSARSALEAGDYATAFNHYSCADTPEAAFGAGLTRAFMILASPNAQALFADFGETPIPATDIFGADGILSREAGRWNGEGTLSLTGGTTLDLVFDRAKQEVPADTVLDGYGSFQAEDWTSGAHGDFSIGLGYPTSPTDVIPAGAELAISFDCSSVYPIRTIDPRLSYVDLSFDRDGVNNYCSLVYFNSAEGCEPDGGSVIVNSVATAPGQPVSYTLENLLLSCRPESDVPTTPDAEPPATLVRVSGTVTATSVSDSVDTTGLHPMFGADYQLTIPSDRTATDLIQHGGATAGELEEVACFLARAGQGSGTVFTLPGVLFGGGDLPISKGDAQLLAGAALVGAAGSKLALAHDFDMPLNQLICDADTSTVPCPTDQEMVDLVNTHFASGFRPEGFAQARTLLADGLMLLDAGLLNVDGSSLFVKNQVSAEGLGLIHDVVAALNQSFSANQFLPHVSPEIMVNLGAFFANPRNPQMMSVPPMRYMETCDVDFCSTSTDIDPAFLDEYFAGSISADWEGEYTWDNEDAVSNATQEAGDSVTRHFSISN